MRTARPAVRARTRSCGSERINLSLEDPVMNATTEIRLTSFSHGGGCGCKIAPGVLSDILKSTRGLPVMPPQLLVGIETGDDAAVYELNPTQALIATKIGRAPCRERM